MRKHIYKIAFKNMCLHWKSEYGCSENRPFGVVGNEYAERLFLWNFVREEVTGCTPDYV